MFVRARTRNDALETVQNPRSRSCPRTTKAMVGAEGFLQGGPIYDYDLEKHDQEATIVDVGGGCGSATIELCRRFPKIEAVLQEKLPIIEAAQSVFLGRKWARIQVRAAFMPHILSARRSKRISSCVSSSTIGSTKTAFRPSNRFVTSYRPKRKAASCTSRGRSWTRRARG